VLIGRTGAMRRRERAIVALTSSVMHGLDHDLVVDCEDLYTAELAVLDPYLGQLDAATLADVDAALQLALALAPVSSRARCSSAR
jgi:hypothetical protein